VRVVWWGVVLFGCLGGVGWGVGTLFGERSPRSKPLSHKTRVSQTGWFFFPFFLFFLLAVRDFFQFPFGGGPVF